MINVDIAKAWKDASYFNSLSAQAQAQVPANPAGETYMSLPDAMESTDSRFAAAKSRMAASDTHLRCCTVCCEAL